MKKASNLLCMLSLCVAMIFLSLFPIPAWAEETSREDTTSVDVVLVLDCSGTMKKNDPEGWTATATRNFVTTLGTENTRLSVIAFGASYGADAYPVGESDPDSKGRVKVAYPLTPVSSDAEREKARDIITGETSERGDYTPLGYALEAAVDVLEGGASADSSAAIIVLSDGIVDGQTDYTDASSAMDYRSIDSACDRAASHSWPIYCMELDYAGDGVQGSETGHYQMRENIPARTGTQPFEVRSASEATRQLNRIFASFFHAGIETGTIDVNGTASFDFTVGEMTAEQTLVITGNIAKLDLVTLTSPDGVEETYEANGSDQSTGDRKITHEAHSILLKLILPEEGTWRATLQGTAQVTLDWTSISLKEMNLDLAASITGDDTTITRGTAVQFDVTLSYNGESYRSEKFYTANQALLYVTGRDPIVMEASEDGCHAEVVFDETGSYDVWAQIDNPDFREGRKKSGTFTYHVETPPVAVQGSIPEQKARIGESLEIALPAYFTGDNITWSLSKNALDDFDYDIEDGVLTLKAGTHAKTYHCTVYADDGSGAGRVSQRITFTVENQPVRLRDDVALGELDGAPCVAVTLVSDAGDTPGWLAALGDTGSESDTFVLEDKAYFTDPDGTPPDVRILSLGTDSSDADSPAAADIQRSGNATVIRAVHPGDAVIELAAVDGNTDSAYVLLTLDVHVRTAAQRVIRQKIGILIPAAVLLLVLLVVLIGNAFGRRIYGIWDVTVNGTTMESVNFTRVRSGRHSKALVNSLLDEAGLSGDFGPAQMQAGNPFAKKVFFEKLETLKEVYLDGSLISGEEKKKRCTVECNQSIELVNSTGDHVLFERRR